MLSWLGKIQKGRATFTGLAVAVLGMVGQTELAQDIVPISEQAGQLITVVGTALATFGVGRKAGYHATQPKRRYH